MTREEAFEELVSAVRAMVLREMGAPRDFRNPREDERIAEELQTAFRKAVAVEVRATLATLAAIEATP